VERARRGDRDAYALLVHASVRRLYGAAHRILRDADQAEDATQQALVHMWRDLPKLRDPDRFEAWSYRLVVRASLEEARTSRRRSARVGRLFGPEPEAPEPGPAIEVREQLERAFLQLSPEHRAVVVLHHQVGLPLTEVAEILGVPYGTAGSRLHYAVRQLRQALADTEPSAEAGGVPA